MDSLSNFVVGMSIPPIGLSLFKENAPLRAGKRNRAGIRLLRDRGACAELSTYIIAWEAACVHREFGNASTKAAMKRSCGARGTNACVHGRSEAGKARRMKKRPASGVLSRGRAFALCLVLIDFHFDWDKEIPCAPFVREAAGRDSGCPLTSAPDALRAWR